MPGARHGNVDEIRSVVKERRVSILRRMHGAENDDVAIGSLQRMDSPDRHLISDAVPPEEFAQNVFLVSERGQDTNDLLQLFAITLFDLCPGGETAIRLWLPPLRDSSAPDPLY